MEEVSMDYNEIFTQVDAYRAEIEKTQAEMRNVSVRLVAAYEIAINGLHNKIAGVLEDEELISALSGLKFELEAETETIASLNDRKLIDDATAKSFVEALMSDEHYAPLFTYLRLGGKIALIDAVEVIKVPEESSIETPTLAEEETKIVDITVNTVSEPPVLPTDELITVTTEAHVPLEQQFEPTVSAEAIHETSQQTLVIQNETILVSKVVNGIVVTAEHKYSIVGDYKPELVATRKKFALNIHKLEPGIEYTPVQIWEIVIGNDIEYSKELFFNITKYWFRPLTDISDESTQNLLVFNNKRGSGSKYHLNPSVQLFVIDQQTQETDHQTSTTLSSQVDPAVNEPTAQEVKFTEKPIVLSEEDKTIIDYTLAKAKHMLDLIENAPQRPQFEDMKKFDKAIESAYKKLLELVGKDVTAVDSDGNEIAIDSLTELKDILDQEVLQEIKNELLKPKKLVAAKKIIETVAEESVSDVVEPKAERAPKWLPEFKKAVGETLDTLAADNLLVEGKLKLSTINAQSSSARMGTETLIKRLVEAGIFKSSMSRSTRHNIELNADDIVVMHLFNTHRNLLTGPTQKRALDELQKAVNSYLAKQKLAAASKQA